MKKILIWSSILFSSIITTSIVYTMNNNKEVDISKIVHKNFIENKEEKEILKGYFQTIYTDTTKFSEKEKEVHSKIVAELEKHIDSMEKKQQGICSEGCSCGNCIALNTKGKVEV